jgi:hypothetical protein
MVKSERRVTRLDRETRLVDSLPCSLPAAGPPFNWPWNDRLQNNDKLYK